MRKITSILLLFVLIVSGCTTKQPSTDDAFSYERGSYFVPVPIIKFSSIQSPCVNVTIEKQELCMEFDLGYQGDLTVTKTVLESISSKSFFNEKTMYSVRGNSYKTQLYQIPQVKIGSMTFSHPMLQTQAQEFITDATFVQNGQLPSAREAGRLGWKLLSHTNVLIDLHNEQLVFCDSFSTIMQHGYPVQHCVSVPMLIERGLVEIELEIEGKTLRCVLDTGATWNILNQDLKEGQTPEAALWNPENLCQYATFYIQGKDLGPITFHSCPIRIPIQIDALLGVEFFRKFLVFLDFTNRQVYLLRGEHITGASPSL